MNDVLRRRAPLIGIAVLFAGLIVAFAPSAFAGRTVLAPTELLEAQSPYREYINRPPAKLPTLQTDQVEGLPNTLSFFRDARAGEFQSWNQGVSAGGPTGTLPLWGLYSPTQLPYLFVPEFYAPALRVGLAFACCLAFTFLFLRRIGISRAIAVAGAVAYTFNGANLALLNRINAVYIIPGLLWAVVRAYRRPKAGNIALVAVFTAWTWIEGFPSGFVYGVMAGAGLLAWLIGDDLVRSWWSRREAAASTTTAHAGGALSADEADEADDGGPRPVRRNVVRGALIGVGLAWGIVLSAFTLVPFAKELYSTGTIEKRVYNEGAHLPDADVFAVVDVQAGGDPMDFSPGGFTAIEAGSLVGTIVLGGAIATMVAALTGRLRLDRRTRAPWTLALLAGPALLFLTYYPSPVLGLIYKVPGLAQGSFHRARFLTSLCYVIVAGAGVDALIRRRRARVDATSADEPAGVEVFGEVGGARPTDASTAWVDDGAPLVRAPRWPAVVGLVAGAVPFVLAAHDFVNAVQGRGREGIVTRSVLVSGALLVAAAVVVWLMRRVPKAVPALAAVLAVLLFAQLAWPYRKLTTPSPKDSFFPVTTPHEELARFTGDGSAYRYAAPGFDFYPNSAMLYDLNDLRGLAISPATFREIVKVANPTAFDRDPLKLILTRDEWNLASPAYDELAIGYFAVGEAELPYGRIDKVDDKADRWLPLDEVDWSPLPAPAGQLDGIGVAARFQGTCDHGRVRVDVSDGDGHTATAWRPASDLDGRFVTFALLGKDFTKGRPLTVGMRYDGADPCRIEVGTPTGTSRPAHWWITDDPDDGVQLVATDGAWIYQRPTAQPLVSAHDRWEYVPDQTTALRRLAARRPGDSGPALLVGGSAPDWVGASTPGRAEVRNARVVDAAVDADVSAQGTALVAIRTTGTPDWVATVDGQDTPVQDLNGAQMAVFVPAGEHHVALRYQPRAFRLGLLVTLLGVLALAAVAGWALWSRRRRGPDEGLGTAGPDAAGELSARTG